MYYLQRRPFRPEVKQLKSCWETKISLSCLFRPTAAWPAGRTRSGAGRLALALILAGIVVASLPGAAAGYNVEKQTQPPTGALSIDPLNVEINVKPGDSANRDITLTNSTADTQTLTFSVQDFEGSPDPSKAFVLKDDQDGKFSARHWLQPELTSIVLNPGEQLTFRVSIAVPSDAEPGGHYAALIVSPADQAGSQQETTTASAPVSSGLSLFLITVEGNLNQEGALRQPEVPAVAIDGPIDISLVFANQGNVHLKPHGTISVNNMLGQTVAKLDVPEWVVLPGSSRRTIISWDNGLLFGRYSVKAEITYSDGSTAVMTASFWAFSWELILAVLAVLVIIALIVVRIIKRRRRGPGSPAGQAGPPGKAGPAAAKPAAPAQPAAPGSGPTAGRAAKKKAPKANLPETAGPKPELKEPEAGQPSRLPAGAHVPLNEIFPSMADKRIVDISDQETKKLISTMIDDQIGLARAYLAGGDAAAARRELGEAREAAGKLSLFSEIGLIDDLLRQI